MSVRRAIADNEYAKTFAQSPENGDSAKTK